jgi:rod shape-determining protein MreD
MKWQDSIFVLVAALIAVFCEAAFNGPRSLLGAQIDLLPSLMVYAALVTGISTVALLAVIGGLAFDSLSANPLGITVLPLFAVGLVIHIARELILRDQTIAQVTLGFAASLLVPVLVLLLLLTKGRNPLVGWGTLWQLIVMSFGGALAAPVWFEMFGCLKRTFVHSRVSESSFRPDREIRRGR